MVIGGGSLYFLFPRPAEVGLMHLHDHDYKNALEIYKKQWNEGDHSSDISIPLANLFTQYGYIEDAVLVMEDFVQEQPDHMEAWQQLGQLYQHAQRPNDYLRTLQALQDLQPDSALLRELSDIYNFHAEYAKQLDVLIELNEMPEATIEDSFSLCYLYAALRRYPEAVKAIHDLLKRQPEKATIEFLELGISLIIETERFQQKSPYALDQFLLRFVAPALSLHDATRIASVLLAQDRFQMGLLILRPHHNEAPTADFLEILTELRLGAGEEMLLLEELWTSFEHRNLHSALLPYLMQLLVKADRQGALEEVLSEVAVDQLDEGFILELAVRAAELQSKPMAMALRYHFGGEIEYYPFIDLLLEIAAGKPDAVILGHHALPGLENEQKQELLDTLIDGDRYSLAFSLLDGPVQLEELPIEILKAAVEWELSINKPAVAQHLLIQYLKDDITPEIQILIGSVLLRQEPHVVAAWAIHNVSEPSVLSTLVGEATALEQHQISLKIVQYLFDEFQRAVDVPLIAMAYVANGRWEESLWLLSILEEESKAYRELYREALINVTKVEPFYIPDLRDILLEDLNEAITPDQRRGLAFLLLEICRDKASAVTVFQGLALNKKPDHPDVQQLLYMWGPAAPAEARQWLVNRSLEAGSNNLMLWCRYLLEMGALTELTEIAQMQGNFELHEMLVYTLEQRGLKQQLHRHLKKTIEKESDPRFLLKMARLARGVECVEIAQIGYSKAMASPEFKMDASLENGMLALEMGDKTKAFDSLTFCFGGESRTEQDTQTPTRTTALSVLGDLAWEKGDKKMAKEIYQSYLKEPYREEKIIALALIRAGQKEQGIHAYKDLVRKYPKDLELRAALAHILMDEGRHKEAAEVLWKTG
jgi:thioredoxin-like negative regulator of GroEL